MKSVIRIFNLIIMAVSGLAAALLFINSTLTFNSRISFDNAFINNFFSTIVDKINQPTQSETDPVLKEPFVNEINVTKILGTDHVNLKVQFDLSFSEINTLMGKLDKELVNQELLDKNLSSIFADLHEAVNILTEYTARTALRSVAKKEIYKQVRKSLEDTGYPSTATDIMDEVGMNDNYFRGFAKTLYDAANIPDNPSTAKEDDGCSVNKFVQTIKSQLEDVLDEADEITNGHVNKEAMLNNPDLDNELRNGFISVITAADLIQSDGETFVKMEKAAYVFLAKILKEQLSGTVSPDELEPQVGESREAYAERLSKLYAHNMLPDVFYTITGYSSLGLFIGVIVFAAIWIILIVITLIRTFSSKKPWTIFGPWFWIVGSLQVVLGLALTIFCKFYLPSMSFMQRALEGSPIKSIAVAPRTSMLIPSMIFLGMIVFAIVYTIIAHPVKKEYKDKRNGRGPKPKEVIIHE
jgi:hypothetical protein